MESLQILDPKGGGDEAFGRKLRRALGVKRGQRILVYHARNRTFLIPEDPVLRRYAERNAKLLQQRGLSEEDVLRALRKIRRERARAHRRS